MKILQYQVNGCIVGIYQLDIKVDIMIFAKIVF